MFSLFPTLPYGEEAGRTQGFGKAHNRDSLYGWAKGHPDILYDVGLSEKNLRERKERYLWLWCLSSQVTFIHASMETSILQDFVSDHV